MFYILAMKFIRIYLRLNFKMVINGVENIPLKGGVILCSNHKSNFDPVIVCAISKRRIVHYFSKKEMFNTPFKNFFMRQLQAFPADREKTDIYALKKSISILKEGNVLGIFAQGTRVKSGEIGEAKSGVSLFALKSGADVVPIGINATYEKGSVIVVNVGKPISFEKYKNQKPKAETLNEMTNIIMENIKALL